MNEKQFKRSTTPIRDIDWFGLFVLLIAIMCIVGWGRGD